MILSLPVGVFGSFLFLQAMGLANDVYAQIGLVMLVGLLGKNAILIVEFAVQRRREGLSLKEAAIEGGKLRFRPIQMTSFAFIAGLIPLVFATGAGAIGNRTIGTTGAGGMLVGTVIGVLVIPGLYYMFGRMADGRKLLKDEVDEPLSEIHGASRNGTENRSKGLGAAAGSERVHPLWQGVLRQAERVGSLPGPLGSRMMQETAGGTGRPSDRVPGAKDDRDQGPGPSGSPVSSLTLTLPARIWLIRMG